MLSENTNNKQSPNQAQPATGKGKASSAAQHSTTRLITTAEKDLLAGTSATTIASTDLGATLTAENIPATATGLKPVQTVGVEETIADAGSNPALSTNTIPVPIPTPTPKNQDSLLEALELLGRISSAKRCHKPEQGQGQGSSSSQIPLTTTYWQQVREDSASLACLFLALKSSSQATARSGFYIRRYTHHRRLGVYSRSVATAVRHLKLAERLGSLKANLKNTGINLQPPTRARKQQRVFQSLVESWRELEKLTAAISRQLKLHPAQINQARRLIGEYEKLEALAVVRSYQTLLGEFNRRATTTTTNNTRRPITTTTVHYWRSLVATYEQLVELLSAGDHQSEEGTDSAETQIIDHAIAAEFRRQSRTCLAIVRLLEAGQLAKAARRIRGYLGQGYLGKLSQGWAMFWWFLTMLVVAAVLAGSLWVLWATVTNFGGFWAYMTAGA